MTSHHIWNPSVQRIWSCSISLYRCIGNECALTICILWHHQGARRKTEFFKKMDKLIFLPLGAQESLEMLLNMFLHIFVPLSLQQYIVFLCFKFRHFFEKFMFLPLGGALMTSQNFNMQIVNVHSITYPAICCMTISLNLWSQMWCDVAKNGVMTS